MPTKVFGLDQIRDRSIDATKIVLGTLTNAEISPSAGIQLSKLEAQVIRADGTIPFTGSQSMGSHYLTNLLDPVGLQDAATKNFVLTTVAGLVNFQGVKDMSTDPGMPVPAPGNKGWYYRVSVASPGNVSYVNLPANRSYNVGDTLISDGVSAAWDVIDAVNESVTPLPGTLMLRSITGGGHLRDLTLHEEALYFTTIPAPSTPLVLATGAAGIPNGVYSYFCAFVNPSGETTIGPFAFVSAFSQQVNISSIPIGTANTTSRRIYRTKAGGFIPYLLTTINDNTTTVYVDNADDSGLVTIYQAGNSTSGVARVDGVRALWLDVTNTAVGVGALALGGNSSNVAIGALAGQSVDIGANNTIVGATAAHSLRSGSQNVILGQVASFSLDDGTDNVVIGYSAMGANVSGSYNVSVGSGASQTRLGSRNIDIGAFAGGGSTTGDENIAIGYFAGGFGGPDGSGNIYLGRNASSTQQVFNSIVIGSAAATDNQQLVIAIADAYFGIGGVLSSSPGSVTLNATGGQGADVPGAALELAGGKGTGNAAGGAINFKTSDVLGSGIALQSLTTKAFLSAAGHFGINAQGQLRLYDGDSSNFIGLRANASRSTDITYTLPATDPIAGQVLSATAPAANVSTLSWVTPPSPVWMEPDSPEDALILPGPAGIAGPQAQAVWMEGEPGEDAIINPGTTLNSSVLAVPNTILMRTSTGGGNFRDTVTIKLTASATTDLLNLTDSLNNSLVKSTYQGQLQLNPTAGADGIQSLISSLGGTNISVTNQSSAVGSKAIYVDHQGSQGTAIYTKSLTKNVYADVQGGHGFEALVAASPTGGIGVYSATSDHFGSTAFFQQTIAASLTSSAHAVEIRWNKGGAGTVNGDLLRLTESGASAPTFGGMVLRFNNGVDVFSFDRSGNLILAGTASIQSQNALKLYDSDNSNFIGLRANASRTTDITYTLPINDPIAGQVLTAAAPASSVSVLSWATPPAPTWMEPDSPEDVIILPGPQGSASTVAGPQSNAVWIDAADGEDALTLPGPVGASSTVAGPQSNAVWIDPSDGEDALTLPGPAGANSVVAGPQSNAVWLEPEQVEDALINPGTTLNGSVLAVANTLVMRDASAGGFFNALSAAGQITTIPGTFLTGVVNGGSAIGYLLNTPAYATTAKILSLQNNSVEKAYIDQAGNTYAAGTLNLGTTIGTAQISFGANIGKVIALYEDAAGATRYGIGMVGAGTGGNPYRVQTLVGGTEYFCVTSTGFTGVGTVAPTNRLEVYLGLASLNRANLSSTQENAPGAPTVATGAAGVLTGTYFYKVTFVVGGVGETNSGTASASVAPSSQQVSLTAIPTGTGAVSSRNIYRTKAGGSQYFFLATVAGNVTTTYTDNTADGSLGTTISPAMNTTAGLFQIGAQPIFVADGNSGNSVAGYQAGLGLRDNGGCTAIGFQSAFYSNGTGSTYLGYQACIGTNTAPLTSSPYLGIFLGYRAGNSITTGGTRSVYITANSTGTTTGEQNVIIGIEANGGAADTNSIGIGYAVSTTASNQLVIGGNTGGGVVDGYIGNGVTASSPSAFTLNASGGSGTNINGATLNIAGGKATGSGTGGAINFKTSDVLGGGTTLQSLTTKVSIAASGALSGTSSIKSSSSSAGVGYATGAGSTVSQSSSKSNGVTINNICGQITTNNASLNDATTVSFTVTNSSIAAADVIHLTMTSGGTGGGYIIWADTITATTSFKVNIRNVSGGALAEALVINYAIFKAVTT